MARLYRYVRLCDRFDTAVFTFILPGSLGIDSSHRDVESKDFVYGHNKWCVLVARNEGHMGVYLVLRGATDGLAVNLDFSFTLSSKEHFTKNETYNERGCKFTALSPKHGRKNFVSTMDLGNRGYLQDNGNYLLNVEMRNVGTVYEQVIQLPSETSKSLQIGSSNRHQKFETGYFSFGGFDWNCVVFPFGDLIERDGQPLLYVVRQTGLDHHCKVKYKIKLGQGDRAYSSESIEQVLDTSGQGTPYLIGCKLYSLTAPKNKLHVSIDLQFCAAISECTLFPLNRNKNQAHLYDRDKQAWLLEADASLQHLKFRLFYTDAHNVPRRHVKYICWSMSVVPRRGHYKPIRALNVPYSHYYTQMEVDVEGFDINTDIKVKEKNPPPHGIKRATPPLQLEQAHCHHSISNPASAILDREGRMTIQIEWIDSHLLYDEEYNTLDEVDSRHKHQMAREILALQAENLSLEKQLHSYQVSIARNNSKGTIDIPIELSVPPVGASPGMDRKSPDKRSSRRERSRDRRKKSSQLTTVPDSQYGYTDVTDSYPGDPNYLTTDPTYAASDPYAAADTKAAYLPGEKGYIDTYNNGDIYGQNYRDDPYYGQDYGTERGQRDYRQDPDYADEYTYYGDKYAETTVPYTKTEQYYDSTSDRYTDYPPDPVVDKYQSYGTSATSPDSKQYKSSSYSPPYTADPRTYSPEKIPESVPYNYGDSYTEDYVSQQMVDRRPGRVNGSVRRTRDQPVDDGYFSSQSVRQADLLAAQLAAQTGPGHHAPGAAVLAAQYLESFPEERTERSPSSGRRSPSVRSKHSHKNGGDGVSRDRPKSRRHHKEK